MEVLVNLILVVTLLQCIHGNVEIGDNTLLDHSPEKSRFKKFLDLFGIGRMNKGLQPGEHPPPEFSPYGYPCAMMTTTTTPAPVVMSPLLCPFPPMMPGQLKPHFPVINDLPHLQQPLPRPTGLNQFPPPPGYPPLSAPGSRPPHLVPGQGPQLPPMMMPPLTPGQSLPLPQLPGQSLPPLPGQNETPPIQNLPHPVLPGQNPPPPTFPGPLLPSNLDPPSHSENSTDQAHSIYNPERPQPVDLKNPENPVKVTPISTDPLDPVKVDPTIVNPSDPVQVSPAHIRPNRPVLIDPINLTNIQPGQPLVFQPMKPMDPKGFTKPPFIPPFGPMNVLINPGFPEKPPPPPPAASPPSSPVLPTANLSLNPSLNPALPTIPGSYPIPPEFLHKPGKLPGPFDPFLNQGMKPPFPPPLYVSGPFPFPPPQNNNISSLNPPPQLPPPPVEPLPPLSTNSSPPTPPPPTSSPPFPKQPEISNFPTCGNPYLKPYVPPGFHLSSINQFLGVPPVPNPKFFSPCPTMDLLKALDFKIMRSLIDSSGLAPLFERTNNYTIFVPSDAAFRRLPRWFRDSLEVDKKLKKALVLNHLVKDDLPLAMLENEELILSARPGGNRLRVNIYQPESTYRTITIDGSEVEKGDVLTSNGRVHIVNKVLMPNLPRNGAQFLSEKLEFESFWNLVKQADLVLKLQDNRPFTLFIPVNEAVQKLNDSTFLSDSEKLKNFINFHLVNGTYYSNGLINNEFLLTNYEKEIKVQVVSDGFAKSLDGINGKVKILKSDISLTNGVAHVINQCISEETPFYVYPQSDEFKNEYGVMRRNFRVTNEEKNIEHAF